MEILRKNFEKYAFSNSVKIGSAQWSAEKFSSRFVIPIAVSAVSFAAIFIRFSESHPVAISFYRFFFSTILLSLLVPFRIDEFKKITRREWITLLSTGFFLSSHMVAWVSSLNYTTVASSVVLVTAHPLLVSWISSRYLGEETSKRAYGGIIFALAGIFIMAFSDYSVSKWSLFGDLLAILAMFSVTGYIIRGRQLRQKFSVVTYAFCVYGFCTLFLAAFSLGFSTSFQIYPVREYLIFFSLALIPTMLGHTLYNWALKFVQARVVSVSLLGEPIGATILAFLILNEMPPRLTIFGASIALTGIFICEKYG